MTIPPVGYQPLSLPSLQPPTAPTPPAAPATPGTGAGSAAGSQGAGFAGLLNTAIDSLTSSQTQADQAAQALAGGNGDIAGAMIATEKASLQMQFAFAVRNRAISAYQQIMAMQV